MQGKSLAIFIGVVALSIHTASAEVRYTVTDLGTLDGYTTSAGSAINSSGQVAGWVGTGSQARAFLYSNGAMTDLGTLGSTAYAIGLNAAGQVVGYSTLADGTNHAFLYNGTMNDLGGLPEAPNSIAYGINSSGQITGLAYAQSASFLTAILCSGGVMTNVNGTTNRAPPFVQEGYGINDQGWITGQGYFGGFSIHAFLRKGGSTLIDLGTVAGKTYSQGWAINATGDVAGTAYSNLDTQDGHAFLYRNGTMVDLGFLPGFFVAQGRGINASDQVVGYDTAWNGQAAFLYENGTLHDLNSLVDPGSHWVLQQAMGINDSGWITGTGVNPAGQTHAFILTPVPEPASLGVLAMAGLLLLRRRLCS